MSLIGLVVSTYFLLMPHTAFASNAVPTALLCIVEHESGGKQFRSDGSPLVSPTDDYGVMQIHSSWLPLARKMGLDIVHNAQDNIEFGIWLANTHGLSQWTTYKYCHGSEAS
jgi:hypothetical protein